MTTSLRFSSSARFTSAIGTKRSWRSVSSGALPFGLITIWPSGGGSGGGCRGGGSAWRCRGRLSEGQGDRLTDRNVVWLKRGRWRGWLRVGRDAHAGEHHEEARDDTNHAGITPRGTPESVQ